ncbi:MAG TPA: hypothetical protein VFA88_05025 [Gaiellaceae bacterium]|nr:hypothetical protein [Gaiellaceae bacterium]
MKRAALAAAMLAALAVCVAPALAAPPMEVRTAVSSQFLFFADSVNAQITVIADRRQVDPHSVGFIADFGNWTQLTPTRTSTLSAGPYVRKTFSFDIACVDLACLPPPHKNLIVHLPRVTVTARRHDGSTVAFRQPWPTLTVTPRFGAAPPGSTPAFQLERGLPPATYRLDPGGLAFALDAVAVVLAAFAALVVLREVLRRRPARVVEIPPLARALGFVRQAKSRPIDDRRRAVGLLARTLADDPSDPRLRATASRVAWSAGDPEPDRLEELARMVESAREDGG